MAQERIGFIGAGNMAHSLAGGLLHNGWEKGAIMMADPNPAAGKAIQDHFGITVCSDNQAVAATADVLIFAVKPQTLKAVSTALAIILQQKRPLVISIAAGIRAVDLQRWLGGGLAIVRAMPNMPALVAAGSTGLVANQLVSPAQRHLAERILQSVGITVWLDHEAQLDAVTALSGSGPAYFFLIMEILEQSGIKLGLDPATARTLTLQTALGAAKMALESTENTTILRERVTSPGGTTEQALKILKNGHLQDLFDTALRAAAMRADELAAQFGKE